MAGKENKSRREFAGIMSARIVPRKVENPRLMVRRIRSEEEDDLELESRGFTLGQTLGEGTYGKVKIATSRRHDGNRVAIKIINKKKAPEEFKNKFLPREIDILTEIQHPNIIKLYEAFSVGKKVYFAMELAGHGDLLEYVKLRGKLTEQRSRVFFTDLTDAMAYLHDLGIVHRDLKCENILLDARNNLKLTDFGFARRMGPTDVSRTYCGSAAYAAPEILRGQAYYGTKSDIWSMGVILYIMVTGLMPYDDADMPKLIRQQQKKPNFPKSASKLSYAARTLVRSLLDNDVNSRANIHQIFNSEWMTPPEPVPSQIGAMENVAPKGEPTAAPTPPDKDSNPFIISQIVGKARGDSQSKTKTDGKDSKTNGKDSKPKAKKKEDQRPKTRK